MASIECEDGVDEVTLDDINQLLEHFVRASYKARDSDKKSETILQRCIKLFSRDYKVSMVNNTNGELCSSYPNRIIIQDYERSHRHTANSADLVENFYDLSKMHDTFKQARFARCRARFVVPVILYEGKHICRSATLSGGAEIYGRSGMDLLFSGGGSVPEGERTDTQSEWQLFDRIRGQDIRLLKLLNVSYICDLMVEKKKVKFGMNVTSSEKVDKENRYADFTVVAIPYPGCEFFKTWRDGGYSSEGMWFDWSQSYVDANLEIPSTPILQKIPVDWTAYKQWDLLQLSQNYLRLLLQVIKDGNGGLLVHCISGWDRTPTFISLLRLSLWADGKIHKSLSATEILYLTIAYDWLMFGHNLSDRVNKGEVIFYFCFNFLKYISSDEFSVISPQSRPAGSTSTSRTSSDSNMDAILLDDTCLRVRCASSNSSSSASCSNNSVENAPIIFSTTPVSKHDADSAMHLNATRGCTSSPVTLKLSHSSGSHGSFSSETSSSAHYTHTTSTCSTGTASSSSPVPVPKPTKRLAEEDPTDSPVLGTSWQVISSPESSGSFGIISNPSLSHLSSSSDSLSSHSHHSRTSSCSEVFENSSIPPVNQRLHRLDSVRKLFHSAYNNMISRHGEEGRGYAGGGTGSLSGLLDQFAERVGLRNARGQPV